MKKLLDFLKNKYELQLGINFDDYPEDIPQITYDSTSSSSLQFTQTDEDYVKSLGY